jgi:transcriptional regulator
VLVHPWDAAMSDDEWRAFVATHPFAQLIAPGTRRDLPVVTPVPVLLDGAVVHFHLARPNPVWGALEENSRAMLLITGDDGYVPAAWKAVDDEDPALGIPTWYYASVQITGSVTVHDDDAAKIETLRAQLEAYEPGSGVADPSVHARRLPGIRAATLAIDEVTGKFKYGGNVDVAHRLAVAERLTARNGGNDSAAAEHVRRRTALD